MKDKYTTLQKIKKRLRLYHIVNNEIVFDDAEEDFYLNELISSAKEYIKLVRNYPHTWTDEQIDNDLETKYSQKIIELVIYDYNKEGMEYENTHSESGVSRQFQSKSRIVADVVPFVDMF